MLKLRKILLCNYPYYILLILTLVLTIIRLSIPTKSMYNENSTSFTGTVIDIKEKNKINLYIKNKETVIARIDNIDNISLGDKVKVYGVFTKPSVNTNEYLFNYNKYLSHKNIYYQIKVNKIVKIKTNKNIYF